MKLKNIILSSALAVLPIVGFGQGQSVSLLDINPDAGSAAMGGNWYGESHTMSIYGNPTSIHYAKNESNAGVYLTSQFFDDFADAGKMNYYAAAGHYRIGIHGIHAGVRYLGGLEIPTSNRIIKPKTMTFDLGYSIRLGEHLSASATASLVSDEIIEKATTVSFNVAAYYRTQLDLAEGAALVAGADCGNMGPDLDYGDDYSKAHLPVYFGGGGSLGVDLFEGHHLTASLGARYYSFPEASEMFTVGAGLEYRLFDMISARGGYIYGENENSLVTAGIGAEYKAFRFDAAYLSGLGDNDMSSLLLTVGMKF